MELAPEALWIGGAGLLGEIGEHGADPRSELVGGALNEAARRRFGGSRDERATPKVGVLKQLGLGIEDSQDLLARVADLGDRFGEAASRVFVPRCQVSGLELLFAPEEVVERGFRYRGALDDPVDADALDALGVEELVCSVLMGASVLTALFPLQTGLSICTLDSLSVAVTVTRSA